VNPFLRPLIFSLAILLLAPAAARCAQEAGPSKAAMDAGIPYLRQLAAADAAYMQRDFSTALKKLDLADQVAPNIPDTWSTRGAIYAEQKHYDEAEIAFEKAAKLNPGDFWPPYDLASLLLLQKKYADAADAFAKLEVYAGHEELVQFKIVFADLLAGKPDAAKPVLDKMKFPADTPAYYYAHAAWDLTHNDAKQGMYWSNTGLKTFSLPECLPFYDELATEHWLPMRNKDGSVPQTVSPTAFFSGKLDDNTGEESAAPGLPLGSPTP